MRQKTMKSIWHYNYHSVGLLLVITLQIIVSIANGSDEGVNNKLAYLDKLYYEISGSATGDDVLFPIHLREKRDVTTSYLASNTTTSYLASNSTTTTTTTTTIAPTVNIVTTSKAIENESTHESSTQLPIANATNITMNENSTATNNSHYNTGNEDDTQIGANKTAKFDHHKYYRSFFKTGAENVNQYWVDMGSLPKDEKVSHESLSNAYRRALTVSLTFDFPFYGHILRNVTIATGGFLFTGSFLHKWLAATQYIAPLMANFDTSVSRDASVIYADNGTSLTVQWDRVELQDNRSAGKFTFQVTIHQSGHIVFAYKDIPVTVTLIQDMEHPVKVGLSDAYIVEKKIFYVRKKTIYEYHKIDIIQGMQIANWTAIVFEPLPLCVTLNSCETCLSMDTGFECKWCSQVGRCSDGYDRHRQEWLEWNCDTTAISNQSICSHLPLKNYQNTRQSGSILDPSTDSLVEGASKSGHGNLWVGLLMAMVAVAFLCGWVTYAYLHPHTPSGQILIKYRPSAWSLRRGEARYTAATMHSIHM